MDPLSQILYVSIFVAAIGGMIWLILTWISNKANKIS